MSQRDGTPVLVTKEGAVALTKVELGTKADNGGTYESFLQELLFEHPEVLPLEQIEPAFEALVPVCREFPTKHGPVDNLFITPDGNIVIVEAKLWRNPESQRRVVAQALDYASCIFEMNYSDFETTALRGKFGGRPKPSSLWALIPEADRLPEHEFVDAVNGNLCSGRIVVLVVGDGIRSETKRLMESLQSHAGFRFTFALVELSIFDLHGTGQRLVVPRTLVRTQLIERGVVRIEGNGIAVTAGSPNAGAASASKPVSGSISAEEFFEAMQDRHPALPERLKTFLETLSPLGIYPEFRQALNLKWAAPSSKTANLGSSNVMGRYGPVSLGSCSVPDLLASTTRRLQVRGTAAPTNRPGARAPSGRSGSAARSRASNLWPSSSMDGQQLFGGCCRLLPRAVPRSSCPIMKPRLN
ncbi:PDDEXK family nuclease [Stigmatella hybrida]|uniref:hypothetical protein n=1 Tax=Stigmatella hybrida TaxID=394097 RepID=UPI001CDAC7CD|nr:hypothetical protein [Stigmatella hybrida]